ncbi:phage tail protein [Aquabacterium sp.]|uniref:phage tail protein n=1 Tax=Aquabacterium sp. TaxID=1872578 RepID=UPI00262BD444|nr:phage tail protein [Aquabacterium sp.]MDD2977901.1 phage tail protein [Aquabacterium sp.]
MRKPADLRVHLTAANPELRDAPDKLTIFVENGNIVASATGSLSYEYRYTLKLIVLDYSGAPEAIVVPLLAWLKVQQIELFDNPESRQRGIRFEAELLNQDTVDLTIEVDLTERMIVQKVSELPETTTRYNIHAAPEPERAGMVGNKPEHWELWIGPDLIAEWDFPAALP